MKSIIIKLTLLLALIFLAIHLSIEPIYTPTAISTPANHVYLPKICAHKSLVSNQYRGNTLQAVKEALASYVEAIEVDIRLSKDNIPFLYHGERLETSTNGHGKAEDYSWQALQQLVYDDAHQSKLLSLEELFKLVGSQKFIFLDIKTDSIFNKELALAVTNLIRRFHLQETCIVESFNPFFLVSMRLIARDIVLMYDFLMENIAIGEESPFQLDKIPWWLKQPFFQKQIRRIIRPDMLGPRFNISKELLKSLIDHGYPIIIWTIDDVSIADDMLKMGIKGLQTNIPIELSKKLSLKEQTVYDAGGTYVRADNIIYVKQIQDILDAIDKAKQTKQKITIAGRRHSMGGQTLLNHAIHLNMMGLDHVSYNDQTYTVKVGAGATWKKVQTVLDQYGRSIKVMQSDNIFTVAGSISVNAHGWQVNTAPIASTIISLKIIAADGKIHHIDNQNNTELFGLIIGGYGLFGVIIEAELATVPNTTLVFRTKYMPIEQFASKFQQYITDHPNVALAYGRLSVDHNSLFEEAGLFWYEQKGNTKSNTMKQESLIAIKRGIFRLSQYFELGKKIRWLAEKAYATKLANLGPISRNSVMNTDIHILWPLYGQSKDILQEYFIPKDNLTKFLRSLKEYIVAFNINILNVTIREVQKDNISLLPYATKTMFGVVCFFSQKKDLKSEMTMQKFAQKVINKAIQLNGTFYLPYRLHYTKQQLLKAYPQIPDWIKLKQKYDPEEIFDSIFFQYIHAA